MQQQTLSFLDNKPPEPAPDRQDRLAIVASIGPEDENIASWLKFHCLAGVRDFHLYDDGAPAEAVAAAQRLAAKEKINLTVMPWKLKVKSDFIKKGVRVEIGSLLLAYCHAIGCHGSQNRWFAFISLADLLVPKRHPTLAAPLQDLRAYSNVSLPRQKFATFKAGAHVDATQRAYADRPSRQEYRCLVDPCKASRLMEDSCNTTDMGRRTANDQGRTARHSGLFSYRRRWSRFASTANIQLNHYQPTASAASAVDRSALDFLKLHGFQSAEEFIASCA